MGDDGVAVLRVTAGTLGHGAAVTAPPAGKDFISQPRNPN